MLQEVILWAIVVLLLVVFVPVGIALFQRLRVPKDSRGAAAAPKKVPPPPIIDQVTTTKVPSVPGVPIPAAPPRAPAPPPDATPIPIKDTKVFTPEGESPAGTEMMMWYGMLNCTSGPLEGQRFVIEEEGFYIGRDPALSQVAIPDGRVSKRHVRILPRNGKVWAIDQNSTNGTFLGKGEQRITEVQLKRGDTLVLADNVATFVYQI
jgi:hypothetical protein